MIRHFFPDLPVLIPRVLVAYVRVTALHMRNRCNHLFTVLQAISKKLGH